MASVLPLMISGGNLGQRHRHFNLQVRQTVSNHVKFEDIEAVPEQSPMDRLFKIDLANKLKNTDYILKTLRDDDLLYVSKALKCKWLLERRDIINPKYLEDELFPHMVMPAITKMKHWLYTNLNDPVRCREFYLYYKCTKFDFALKFLIHCDNEFVHKEWPELLIKISPHYMKVFAEKSPQLVKLYFDLLASNRELVKRYLADEKGFYNNIKYVLKTDPDLYLDIVEKYHNFNQSMRLSPAATDFILRFHKNRFRAKLELYVAHLLHMPTVAKRLSVEECQEIVIRLARATYLEWWFSYANVEPLMKRVTKENRAAFKKRVFVEKDIGERVVKCPYEFPTSPVIDHEYNEPHIFDDKEYEPISMGHNYRYRAAFYKQRGEDDFMMAYGMGESCPMKSELQKLFDEFRFVGFEGTLHELKRRIGATSLADRRRDMLLVLVSKSGGRVESVRELLQLALKMQNEPVHSRAAIVRSLVKRASAWRLPEDEWNTILDYGRGLGLDGTTGEAECREGLQAVVLRQLLATGECNPLVRVAFLDDFSTLSEYKLTTVERATVSIGLQSMLLTAATNAEPDVAVRYLGRLLDVMNDYRVNVELSPLVSAVTELVKRNATLAKPLLHRLYTAHVCRRQLFRQYLEIRHDDAALVNVLRHGPELLEPVWFVNLLTDHKIRANRTLLKLAVYFSETKGTADKIREALQNKVKQDPDFRLVLALAILANDEQIQSMLCANDEIDKKPNKLAAALRAYMHRSRPATDALALGWRRAGLKAVSVRAMRCRPVQIMEIIQTLLQGGVRRPVRLALTLALLTDCVTDILATAAKIRPLAVVRAALFYFRKHGDQSDPQVWEIIRPLLSNTDLKPRVGLRYILKKVERVPEVLKPNYCAVLYLALDKVSKEDSDDVLGKIMTFLHTVSDDMLSKVLSRIGEHLSAEDPESYPAIVIRYLMLSTNMDELHQRFEAIGAPFLEKILEFRDKNDESKRRFFESSFEQVTGSLLYNFAYFDIQYQCCLAVIEEILKWMRTFVPKHIHFGLYVKIHATMLYFKAVRQSMKEYPEIFEDNSRKMSEGLDIVGFAFGKCIIQEVVELRSKYFDSVVELYSSALTKFLSNLCGYGSCTSKFIVAIIKGIITESAKAESRLGILVLKANRYHLDDCTYREVKELILKQENQAVQLLFYAHAMERD